MEVAARKQQLLLLPSMAHDPNSPSSSTSSSSPSSAAAASSSSPSSHRPPPPPPPPSSSAQPALPPSPRTVVPRTIDTTPFPTTFVQADTASFKQVVQMLTGSDTPPSQRPPAKSNHHQHHHSGAPCRPKKQVFKLYERRSGVHKNFKMIAPLAMAAAAAAGASSSPRKAAQHQQQEALSPSVLDFPSLALSPVTPLVADPFNRSPASASSASPEEEAAAIAQKGFFLHPSPRSAEPPRLLPLFPVTSPRVASSSSAAAAVAVASPSLE
uniref:VQ domain-containing protein n=1 Tax=Oryza meridionalis TaxID=40149 RepID=A0A0E0DTZ3_9ORYZ